jgi:hypothetical protein
MEAWADMDGRAARSIEAILDEYNKKQRAARLEMELRKAQREEFLSNFAGRIQSTVRPVMVEAAELLKRSGHDYEIIENSDGLQADGKTLNAAIVLAIFPEGERPNDPRNSDQSGWPHIAFFVNPNKNTIFVHESAMMPNIGGPSGTAGEYTLDEITAEIVQKHIVSVLARAMGIGRVKRTTRTLRAPRSRRRTDDPIPAAPFNYLAR